MYNLFLDDIRNPVDCYSYTKQPAYLMNDWTIVRDYNEFVKTILRKGVPTVISFDHDLADEHYSEQENVNPDFYDGCTEKTGYHCAKFLIDHCMDYEQELPQAIMIHSMNVVGSQNIKSLFNTYLKVHGKQR